MVGGSSPSPWPSPPQAAEGYLRTVPTASLLRHFAQHSPLLAPGKRRLGAVFGVDNLAGGRQPPGEAVILWMDGSELRLYKQLRLVGFLNHYLRGFKCHGHFKPSIFSQEKIYLPAWHLWNWCTMHLRFHDSFVDQVVVFSGCNLANG